MLPNLERKQRSTTQALAPLYRKVSGLKYKSSQNSNLFSKEQPTIDDIHSEYSNLNTVLERLQEALNERMNVHQRQLLSIVKIQLSKMLEDIRKVVKVFNLMIKQKNFSQDLWETKNQVQYFKFQAVRLFQQNNSLRKQVKILKKQIQQMSFLQKCQNSALRNLGKKLARQKAHRSAMSANNSKQKSGKTKTIVDLLSRKRHQSLFSAPENKSKINSQQYQITPKQQIKLQKHLSLNQSTLSNTNIKGRVKTQAEQIQLQVSSPKIEGYSEHVSMINSPARNQKIRQFKEKMSVPRRLFKECKPIKDQHQITNEGAE